MTRQRAVLFIGGHLRQIRVIEAARALGLFVAVTDRSPDAPARIHADRFAVIDATDVDAIVAFADDLAGAVELIGAYGIADYAFAAVGAVVDRLGLAMDGSDVFGLSANKIRARRCFAEYGVPVANGVGAEGAFDARELSEAARRRLEFPVVVKPAEGMNSDGVVTVREADAGRLDRAIAEARRYSPGVVIEELAEGRHFNVDGLFADGVLHPVCITERHFIDSDGHVALYALQPAAVTAAEAASLRRTAESAGRALGFCSGPMTADVILTASGPVVIEASPHYHSVTTSGILDDSGSIKAWLACLAGEAGWKSHLDQLKPGVAGYYLLYHGESGVLDKVEGLDALRREPCIVDVDERRTVGARIEAGRGKPDLCAVVSFFVPEREALPDALAAIPRHVRYHTVPAPAAWTS